MMFGAKLPGPPIDLLILLIDPFIRASPQSTSFLPPVIFPIIPPGAPPLKLGLNFLPAPTP